MSNPAKGISPSKGLYIKLGRSGIWEKECLENGILRFGYKETPFDAAVSGDWETVRKVWLDAGRTRGQRQGTLFRSVISLKQRRTRYGLRFPRVFSGGDLPSRALKNMRTGKEATRPCAA